MKQLVYGLIMLLLLVSQAGYAQEAEQPETKPQAEEELAGEFFGVPVPLNNYYFAKAGVLLFGNKWGGTPRNSEELEKAVWEHLLLSFLAFQENITVPQEEVEAEIAKTLQSEGAAFDWRQDEEAYAAWVQDKTKLSVDVFEGQIRHLMQIDAYRRKVLASIEPQVTEEEAFDKFQNEHNTLSVEIARFDTQEDAAGFYKKVMRNKRYWDRYKKKNPDIFKRPGFVSLEFQIDLWGFPQDAVYGMMRKQAGDIYPPRAIYKGFAVFKILQKQPAQESDFTRVKEEYIEKVKVIKKHQGLKAWINNVRQQAQIKVYKTG